MDERERVDGPLAAVFDLGLVSTEHPVAGAVHLNDGNAGRSAVRRELAEAGGQGLHGRQISAGKRNEIAH